MNIEQNRLLQRRKLLGLAGAISVSSLALPASWHKPVINAVLLPAHAQTTCITDTTRVAH